LNNLIELKKHPLKSYLQNEISCVMGTDGYGLYGTDSIDEQLALANFLKITDTEFHKMQAVEHVIIERQTQNFTKKSQAFEEALSGRTVRQYYTDEFQREFDDIRDVKFEIHKRPSYPVFKENVKELPWDKYPVIIAGGSFTSGSSYPKLSDSDKQVLQALLDNLDPQKVFFVVGHKLAGHEKYIVEHNPGFDIYAIIPSLMDQKQMRKLQRANLAGIRISTEPQEMGIYKSFNYEIFERRNCVLFAFDGNSSIANLVQEARNGKGRAWVFTYPKSAMLKAKAKSLEGYVTNNATVDVVIEKIREFEDNIGTKI
ncbi:MAG: adenosine deaminase, partial [Lachnospiraceae bacterium]|nr:adenosine deaminase [Lachnospiraceae bacterium]